MRIVIIDLHCNGFLLREFDRIVNKRWSFTKHAFFLEEALKEGYEVVDYITGTQSGLWIGKNNLLLNRMEASYVLKKNGLKNNVLCITDADGIREDDLVVFYSHLNDSFDMYAVPGHKYCNVNHFFSMKSAGGTALSEILLEDGFEGYICESDVLNDSPFFRKYLPVTNKKILLLPYVAEKRFRKKKPFGKRENRALALGSVGIEFDMYREIYGTNQLHPMRRELLERKNENMEQIECGIEEIVHPKDRFPVREWDGRMMRFLKRFCNHFYRNNYSPFRQNGKNTGYYNKDRVELLNDYKMFIYPEEVTGIPALGFAEGMSCGCAYIGLDSPMYTKIGMMPGVHYIGYDGTYDDMLEKIQYYQNHSDGLEQIAENGYRFVKEHLSAEAVFKKFMEQFKNQSQETADK